MFSKLAGIDLGTANTLIYVKGRGIVLDEPSVIAMNRESGNLVAVGKKAKDMQGRTPEIIASLKPLKEGIPTENEGIEIMLEYFIRKLRLRGLFHRPTLLVLSHSGMTFKERNAVSDAAMRCGAKKVLVEERIKAAALGAGVDILKPSGCMVVDIGAGMTEIAVLSLNEVLDGAYLKTAGDQFDHDIMNYVKKHCRLLIGQATAEEIKIKAGAALKDVRSEQLEISGRNLITGLPHSVIISSNETAEALSDSLSEIVLACRTVLENVPAEISRDLKKTGIVLTGGGSLLAGLDQLLCKELKIPVRVAENALSCVADGTGVMLEKRKAAR